VDEEVEARADMGGDSSLWPFAGEGGTEVDEEAEEEVAVEVAMEAREDIGAESTEADTGGEADTAALATLGVASGWKSSSSAL
jgi:hypothetical protein